MASIQQPPCQTIPTSRGASVEPSDQQGSPYFTFLPVEVQSQVFCLLDIYHLCLVQQVCKQWYQLARSDQVVLYHLWRNGILPWKQTLQKATAPMRANHSAAASQKSDGHRYSRFLVAGRAQRDFESPWTLLASTLILQSCKSPLDIGTQPDTWCHGPLKEAPDLVGQVDCYAGGSGQQSIMGSDVWRFKIDPVDHLLIMTSRGGSLTIKDLASDKCLWRDHTVAPYAHLEYSEGWIVHSCDEDDGPHQFQLWRFERTLSEKSNPKKGHLASAGRIHYPHRARAFRFLFPFLAIACKGKAAIFDVRDLSIVSEINLTHFPDDHAIGYIEFDDEYIFVIATPPSLGLDGTGGRTLIYSRQTRRHIHTFHTFEAWSDELWDRTVFYQQDQLSEIPSAPIFGRCGVWRPVNEPRLSLTSTSNGTFTAVHPDKTTGSLCLGTARSWTIIKNYKKFLRHGSQIDNYQACCLYSTQGSTGYLAVDSGGLTFVPGRRCFLTWMSIASLFESARRKEKALSYELVTGSNVHERFSGVTFKQSSCIQMDAVRVAAVGTLCRWEPLARDHRFARIVFVLDFQQIVDRLLHRGGTTDPGTESSLHYATWSEQDEIETSKWSRFQRAHDAQTVPSVMDTGGNWGPLSTDGMVADVVWDENWFDMDDLMEGEEEEEDIL